MNLTKAFVITLTMGALSGCEGGFDIQDKTGDGGLDRKQLKDLKAGIWIDPNGCDHWIVDDGVEGYLSQRLDRYGKPICTGSAGGEGFATGGFKSGSEIPDPF